MIPFKIWWRSVYEWLTRTEPAFPTVIGTKDRSLHGKARRKARRNG